MRDSKSDSLTSGTRDGNATVKIILYGNRISVSPILNDLTDDELTYVMALALFGLATEMQVKARRFKSP